jgi:hypothetical protein
LFSPRAQTGFKHGSNAASAVPQLQGNSDDFDLVDVAAGDSQAAASRSRKLSAVFIGVPLGRGGPAGTGKKSSSPAFPRSKDRGAGARSAAITGRPDDLGLAEQLES